MKITKIQAPPKLPERLRTAGYARVSDGKDAMLSSLSVQVSYFSQKIQSNPAWQYVGVYADEALTGTKDARPEFQRLLEDCRAGEVDLILTKSVSRFARNTVTLLEVLRELSKLGVAVHFERENVWSNTGDGELLLTILASYSQEESRSVSENCKWRIRRDFAEGKSTPCRVYGYRQKGDNFVVVPEEATIVKAIFADYLCGSGILKIRKKLLAQGISFSQGGLKNLLQNEKYAGDLLLQKSFIANHLTKKKLKNTGQLPQYLVENHHKPIIDRVTFDAVQVEMQRRAAQHHTAPPQAYPFTSLIKCGICGAGFRHKIVSKKSVWICATFNTLGREHCTAQQIPEDILTAKAAEAGGLDGLREILVPGPFALTFIYGSKTVDLTWQHRSRRDSWTPEMREAARQREIDRRAKQ